MQHAIEFALITILAFFAGKGFATTLSQMAWL